MSKSQSTALPTTNSDVPHLHQSLAVLILVLSLEAIVDTLLDLLIPLATRSAADLEVSTCIYAQKYFSFKIAYTRFLSFTSYIFFGGGGECVCLHIT